MSKTPYEARQIEDGPEKGKWAVFQGNERCTKGGTESGARSWANFMNRTVGDE